MQRATLLLFLLPLATQARPGVRNITAPATAVYAKCYGQPNQGGVGFRFADNYPDLSVISFEDVIDSVTQTGMWMFYQDKNYNPTMSGRVYWGHGIDYSYNLPTDFVDQVSSMRYAGHPDQLNADSWTVYDGLYFQGEAHYSTVGEASLGTLDGAASSMIITGTSDWTVYSANNYEGLRACMPAGMFSTSTSTANLTVSIFADLTEAGIFGNVIRSVSKGCNATTPRLAPEPPHTQHASLSGAWGYLGL